MKKVLLPLLVIGLIVLAIFSTCFTAGAILGLHQIEKCTTLQKVGKGTIKGTVINQKGNPVSFVRVVAFGDRSGIGRKFGFTITHLLLNGKGTYEMQVEAGRYLFVRAAKLPLYIGAWAGPIFVNEGETVNLDLSITYIGPDITTNFASSYLSAFASNVLTFSAIQSHSA